MRPLPVRRIPAVFLLALLVVLSGCNDPALTKLAKALNDTQIAMKGLQTSLITANQQGLVSDGAMRPIMEVCVKVDSAGLQATQLTRQLTKLDKVTSTQILGVLTPVIAAVGSAVVTGPLQITNVGLRDKVTLALQTIQTGLNTAQIIVAATAQKGT